MASPAGSSSPGASRADLLALLAARDAALAAAQAERDAAHAAAAAARAERAALRGERDELFAFVGGAAGLRAARLGERFLDVLPFVAAAGFAADVSHCLFLCGLTFRAGDRGATNDMIVQSLRLQCGARAAHEAAREEFFDFASLSAADDDDNEGVLNITRLTTQLIRATALNNLPRVLQLVQLGAPLNLVDEEGDSALHWASRAGHAHIVAALLAGKFEGRGAAVDLQSSALRTPIMVASKENHVEVARLLLARGADLGVDDDNSDNAIHLGVLANSADVVALLCAAPGGVDALRRHNRDGRSPLALAFELGHEACEASIRSIGGVDT